MPVDPRPPRPVALVCAVLAGDPALLDQAVAALAARLGPVRAVSPDYAFDYTDYYEAEMGPGLRKRLVGFAQRVDPAVLPSVKQATMALEHELGRMAAGGLHRRANLDPGLVSQDSLVLASTKSSGHRICIAPSLYAEVTLLYQKGRYRPFAWTYPDYRTELVQGFLLETRAWLRA